MEESNEVGVLRKKATDFIPSPVSLLPRPRCRRSHHRRGMEAAAATGAVARRGAFCPADALLLRFVARGAGCAGSSRVSLRRPGGFADQGHLRYYAPSARSGGREEEKRVVKRRAKLVKELAVFQAAVGGIGVEVATPGEAGVRRITLEEAADVVLAHLELMRAEEKEMKKRREEEKKAAKRAAAKQGEGCEDDSEDSDSEDEQERKGRDGKMRDRSGCKDSDHKEMKRKKKLQKAAMKAACKKKVNDCDESESSSSSSESSDSDCEEEVMDMDSLRTVPTSAGPVTGVVQMEITAKDEFSLPTAVSRAEEGVVMVDVAAALKCASSESASSTASACCSRGKGSVPVVAAVATATAPMERIEVCMGGKCKKSGAVELMQAFERRVGMEGAVVGCKCMGKCREGPNVRIRNVVEGDEGDESIKAVRNPLCLGVGLDDVGTIVAKFFAEEIQEKDVLGLLAARTNCFLVGSSKEEVKPSPVPGTERV